jgi:hypothetical protein
MAALLALPNELIMWIYAKCPTVQDAASLSAANKQLYSIWLEKTDHIAEAILRPQIPAYAAAVELAILEEIWIDGNTQLSSIVGRPSIHFYFKRLLHIADCASNAATWWNAELDRTEQGNWLDGQASTSAHTSYCLLRKILLGAESSNPRLHEVIDLAICAASEEEIRIHEEMSDFLMDDAAYYETGLHDAFKIENMRMASARVGWV